MTAPDIAARVQVLVDAMAAAVADLLPRPSKGSETHRSGARSDEQGERDQG